MLSGTLPRVWARAQSGYMRYHVPLVEDGVELYEVRALLGKSRGSGESSAATRSGNYALHANENDYWNL